MARIIKDPYLVVNSVNLSSFLRQIELSYEVDEKDATTMDDNTMNSYPGLKKWRITGTLLQSFASSEVDDTLFDLVGDTTAFPVILGVTSASAGATNPHFTGNGYLIKYNPMGGSAGDLHETQFEIAAAGDLTRDITP